MYSLTDPRNPDIPLIDWIQEFFWVPELKGPIVLGEYQIRCLNRILTTDALGNFPYSVIIWSDIKKSIKSCIAAAVTLARAYRTDWGQFVLVANDLDQADSRVGYYIRRALELSPKLKGTYKIRGYQIWLPNRTRIESVPIDPSGEAGGNADMIVFSELWGAHQEAQKRMWTEMTLSPTKYGKSFRWVETYAGYTGESLQLEQLYEQGTKKKYGAVQIWDDLEAYENPTAKMFCLWNTKPRNPWQTDDYYNQERAVLLPNDYRRVHQNEWVSSEESFVPMEWWDACKVVMPVFDPKEPIVLGLDAGTDSDLFGIVGVSRNPSIRDTNVLVRLCRFWKPGSDGKIEFLGTKENPGPELWLREFCKTHNVVMVAYDPYQMHDMARRLSREGVVWMNPFTQQGDRLLADRMLYDLISQRRIGHDGDPNLRDHISNANRQSDLKDDGSGTGKMRLIKKSALSKIDLAVCTSMASFKCLNLAL